ncbi:MAG: twin-arginine translocation signal domain-containing protein, partial [Actinomycetota bacterium]
MSQVVGLGTVFRPIVGNRCSKARGTGVKGGAVELTRRDFFKISAAGGAGAAWATFGFDLEPAYAQVRELKIARATEVRSVCPYCA